MQQPGHTYMGPRGRLRSRHPSPSPHLSPSPHPSPHRSPSPHPHRSKVLMERLARYLRVRLPQLGEIRDDSGDDFYVY